MSAKPPQTGPVIRAIDVARSYGRVEALAGVDLAVERGETVAVLGPNGAGKTTLVEILAGLRRCDRGVVEVLGEDPRQAGRDWRARVGAVLQLGAETDEFTARELLAATAACYPAPQAIDDVAAALGITTLLDRRVKRLSGGQRRRVDVALGIVGNPELLFLDEPTTGLDAEVRHQIWEQLRRLTRGGVTVLLTTHYLEEVEQIADRAVVLVEGRAVARGTPAEISGASSTTIVSFELAGTASVGDLPETLPGARMSGDERRIRYETNDATALASALLAWSSSQLGACHIERLEISRPRLEDSYLRLLHDADGGMGGER